MAAGHAEGEGADGNEEAEADAEQGGEERFDQTAQKDLMIRAIREDGQPVKQFSTMQTLIKQEADGAKELKLKQREKELIEVISGVLKDIKELPNREMEIMSLQSDIATSVSFNMQYLERVKQ